MGFFKKMNDIVTPWEIVVLFSMTWIAFDIPLEAAFQHKPSPVEIVLDIFLSAVFFQIRPDQSPEARHQQIPAPESLGTLVALSTTAKPGGFLRQWR